MGFLIQNEGREDSRTQGVLWGCSFAFPGPQVKANEEPEQPRKGRMIQGLDSLGTKTCIPPAAKEAGGAEVLVRAGQCGTSGDRSKPGHQPQV